MTPKQDKTRQTPKIPKLEIRRGVKGEKPGQIFIVDENGYPIVNFYVEVPENHIKGSDNKTNYDAGTNLSLAHLVITELEHIWANSYYLSRLQEHEK